MNKASFFVAILCVFCSCKNRSCAEWNAVFAKQKPCNLIVSSNNSVGMICSLNGYDSTSGQDLSYHTTNEILYEINSSIQKGDTLVKTSGSSFYTLKKKLFTIKFYMACDSLRIPVGIKQDTVINRLKILHKINNPASYASYRTGAQPNGHVTWKSWTARP